MNYGWNEKVKDRNKQCLSCYGYGWHLREYALSDDTYKITCQLCNGSGKKSVYIKNSIKKLKSL